jgi:excisionase family DNA binding protein
MSGQQPPIGLADLVTDPSRVAELQPDQLSALLAQVSAVQACMAARLVATTQDQSNSDRDESLLTVEQAASRLGVSEDWLYRRTGKLPFVVRMGRQVRFSASGIDRYIKNRTGRTS